MYPAMIIDAHVHPVAPDTQRYPIDPVGGQQSPWSIGVSMTPDQLLAEFAKRGVDAACLVQAATVHGYDNSYCVESAAKDPGKFVAMGSIDALAPKAAETLRHWVKDRGMAAVRLIVEASTGSTGRWLDDPQTYPVWETAQELGIPICLQMRANALDMAQRMVERFAGVKVLVDHFARAKFDDGPPYAQAADLWAMAKYPNVYMKFSPYTYRESAEGQSTTQAFFETALERFGARRLIWGTNFPNHRGSDAGPYTDLVDEAQEALAFASQEDRDWMFGGTIRSIFPSLGGKS